MEFAVKKLFLIAVISFISFGYMTGSITVENYQDEKVDYKVIYEDANIEPAVNSLESGSGKQIDGPNGRDINKVIIMSEHPVKIELWDRDRKQERDLVLGSTSNINTVVEIKMDDYKYLKDGFSILIRRIDG